MKLFKLILSNALLLLTLSAYAQTQNTLNIKQAWVREAPPHASVMVAYMQLINNGKEDIVISHVSSPNFKKSEIHLSKDVNGVAKMLPQKNLKIPAQSRVVLKPGSYHLMLIKPKKWFRQGDRISVNFLFSNKQKQTLSLPVKKSFKEKIMKCSAGKCGR